MRLISSSFPILEKSKKYSSPYGYLAAIHKERIAHEKLLSYGGGVFECKLFVYLMRLDFKILSFLFTVLSVFVGACVPQQQNAWESTTPSARFVDAETLLYAQGRWDLVEDQDALTPEQQHLRARRQVDPSHPSKTRNYTSKAVEADVNEEVHFRVLRLKDGRYEPLSDVNAAEQTRAKNAYRAIAPKPAHKPFSKEKSVIVASKSHTPQKKVVKDPKIVKPSKVINTQEVSNNARTASKPKKIEWSFFSRPSVMPADFTVTSVRMGEHPGKTRFVLDVSGSVKFETRLDNKGRMFFVTLPATAWKAQDEKMLKDHALIKGYAVRRTSNGKSILAVGLKKDAELVFSTLYGPNKTYTNYRVVFDLRAL